MNRFYYIIIVVAYNCVAQTANTGTVVIEPNTVFSTHADFINTAQGSIINDGEAYIFKNFRNNGIVTHSSDSEGLTRFQGENPQVIDGAEEFEFKDVLFYNQSLDPAIQLYGNIKVNGEAEFNRGIVNNRDFEGKFLFTDLATQISTWNGSFVDGAVEKLGNKDFVYPVGNKQLYRFCAMSAPTESNSKFEATYFLTNSDPIFSHSNKDESIEVIDNTEYWTVYKQQGESNIILTLSYSAETTPADLLGTHLEQLIIVGYDETAQRWVDLGGVLDTNLQAVSTPIEVTKYGYFTLARKFKEIEDCVKIFNVITPITQDGKNDFFLIECIENFPDNDLMIFNRWGVKVFETKQYGINGNVFEGYSDGRTTIDGSNLLPTGTYFYVLRYKSNDGVNTGNVKKTGYLYLNAE